MIEQASGIQWPFPSGAEPEVAAERRLFADGRFFHPDRRARFRFDPPRPVSEQPSTDFPLLLLTGRVFIPMHYAATNRLTHADFDPYSRQPSYKNAAVEIRRSTRSFRSERRKQIVGRK